MKVLSMTTNKNKAFTLLELLVTVMILGLLAMLSISNVLNTVPEFETDEDSKKVEQALRQARSIAIRESRNINADFSSAINNKGDNGGIITIEQADGTIIKSIVLSHNVLFNSSTSTISDNKVAFDYLGQPVDNTGEVTGFTEDNNLVTISFYKSNAPKYSKNILISPVTGNTRLF